MEARPGLVSDFDDHPDELYVRHFRVPRRDVLRLDDSAFVCEAESEGVVRHYAFADEWFKINVTFDRAGSLVETPASEWGATPLAFNCDIATPMLRHPSGVQAVDLFLDVLVRADGVTYDVVDRKEFDEAVRSGLVSAAEADGARPRSGPVDQPRRTRRVDCVPRGGVSVRPLDGGDLHCRSCTRTAPTFECCATDTSLIVRPPSSASRSARSEVPLSSAISAANAPA